MITFLPYPDFEECAVCLDYRRLGKQRLEAKWILDIILGRTKYVNHPLVRMWENYPEALIEYGIRICREWRERGYKDNQLQYFEEARKDLKCFNEYDKPDWSRKQRLHSSHRTKLITKDPIWYAQYGWSEKPDPSVKYYWPS
jgi:hypothetical protein